MLRAPVLAAFLAVALGVAFGDWAGIGGAIAWAFVGCTLLVLVPATRRRYGVMLVSLAGFLGIGALRAAQVQAPAPLSASPAGCEGLFRARVDGPVGLVIEGGKPRRSTQLELIAERCGGHWMPRQARVAATLHGEPALGRGDVVDVRLELEPTRPAHNPTDADALALARRDGLAGRARARSPYVVAREGRGVLAAMDRARQAAAGRFFAALPPETAPVAAALALGDQSAVTPEQREVWAASGLAHLLSVSGLHVTLVAALLFWFAYHLLASLPGAAERFSTRRAAALAALPGILAFCLWAGAPPAAVRAAIMAGALFAGIAVARPSAPLNGLGLAGLGILLVSPPALYDPGFLLSFVAMAGLLLLPAAESSLTEEPPGRLARWLTAGRRLLIASVVASAATLPVTARFFGRASLVSPLTNLVGVPLGSALATPLALLHALAGAVSEPLGELVAAPLGAILALLAQLVELSAGLPLAEVALPPPTALEIGAYLAGLLLLVTAPRRRRLGLALVCMTLLAGGTARAYARLGDGRLTVLFPYVGQGDGAVVFLPEGGVVVVDAGGGVGEGAPDPGRRVMAPLLRSRAVRNIDLAVLSHPHPDHLGGFAYLAERWPIRELWWSGEGEDLPQVRALLERVRAGGGEVRVAAELPELSRREGVAFRVLHPRPRPSEGMWYFPELSTNDNSLAMVLSLGERSVFLAGDLEAEGEALVAPFVSRADVLKVPHHGSRTSSTPAFLDAVAPRLAVISCGVANVFDFPAPEVLERYRQRGAEVLRTDEDGLVELSTDGGPWQVRAQRGRALALE